MKTKKQIEHFLKQKKYKSEIDFEGISSYCKNKYGIKLSTPSSYPSSPDALDYATFANWYDNGFGAGDAVKWEDNIGLVQDGDTNKAKICLKIDRNGPIFDSFIVPVEILSQADESALKRINEVLNENGKEFGNPFFVITEKYIPGPNSLVCFHNHKTDEEGYGVVRIIKQSGEIIMYCYVIKGKDVKYSMNEYLGMSNDFSFTPFKAADYQRKALDVELAKVGKTWNHFLKRVEPIDMKVPKGERYWYITDKMQVVAAIEKETVLSNKRYLVGNYFKQQEDAIRILEEMNEILRNFLAEPRK